MFVLHDRKCHLCGEEIVFPEPWDLDHVIEWTLTRDDSDENVRPAHSVCHSAKSGKRIAQIRKADRQRQKHNGSWPKSRRSLRSPKFLRKVSGDTVPR